jgi:hypothetical protein
MRAQVVLGTMAVGFLLAVVLVLACARSPGMPIVHRSSGFPSDPSLIGCGSGPNAHLPCAANGISDQRSSPIPCHSGPDQIADCIKP